MKFQRRDSKPVVPGFPETEVVRARRLYQAGDRFRRTGPVVLSNGTNSFVVDPSKYASITVVEPSGESASYDLAGSVALSSESTDVLAKFGSHGAALNAQRALLKEFAGISGGAGVLGKTFKWSLSVAGAMALAVVFGALLTPSRTMAVAAGPVANPAMLSQMQASQGEGAAGAQPTAAGFNPSEPSLEDLASGKYKFEPKLKAPEVQVPALNCAAKH